MDWGGPSFIVAIIALSTMGWLVNNWIRAKHGYELEDEWGGKTAPKASQSEIAETARLKEENRELHGKLDSMQDRMIVLEKIVTDRGYTLSEEIEALRDTPSRSAGQASDSGVRLDLSKKETSA